MGESGLDLGGEQGSPELMGWWQRGWERWLGAEVPLLPPSFLGGEKSLHSSLLC